MSAQKINPPPPQKKKKEKEFHLCIKELAVINTQIKIMVTETLQDLARVRTLLGQGLQKARDGFPESYVEGTVLERTIKQTHKHRSYASLKLQPSEDKSL